MKETKSLLCPPSLEDDQIKHLIDGPIDSTKLLSSSSNSGALIHFAGIIRGDLIHGKTVDFIDYEVYAPVAENILHQIQEESKKNFKINNAQIFHSFGKVAVGECSLLVIIESKHRKEGFQACMEIVDRIKAEAPVWKQEFYKDQSYQWVRCNH